MSRRRPDSFRMGLRIATPFYQKQGSLTNYMEFQYNPESVKRMVTATYTTPETPILSYQSTQFKSMKPIKMSMKLFLNEAWDGSRVPNLQVATSFGFVPDNQTAVYLAKLQSQPPLPSSNTENAVENPEGEASGGARGSGTLQFQTGHLTPYNLSRAPSERKVVAQLYFLESMTGTFRLVNGETAGPFVLELVWRQPDQTSFFGYLESVDETITMVDQEGYPTRAEVKISLIEVNYEEYIRSFRDSLPTSVRGGDASGKLVNPIPDLRSTSFGSETSR